MIPNLSKVGRDEEGSDGGRVRRGNDFCHCFSFSFITFLCDDSEDRLVHLCHRSYSIEEVLNEQLSHWHVHHDHGQCHTVLPSEMDEE